MQRPAKRQSPLLKRRLGAPARRAALLAMFSLVFSAWASAQQSKPSEYSVKAVYLYNFGRFVRRPAEPEPANPQGPFWVCVLGQDPFGALLDDIVKGEMIDGKPIATRRMGRVEDAAGCGILFVGSSEQDRLVKILDALMGKPTLTVSEIPGFCDRGGMIQFVIESDKVRFQVNLIPAQNAGLVLSSQLLKVATSVRGNAQK